MSLPVGNRGNGMRVLPPRPPRPSLWSRIKAWLFQSTTERSDKYRDHPIKERASK